MPRLLSMFPGSAIQAACTKHGFGGQEILVFLVQDKAGFKILKSDIEQDEENQFFH